MNTKLRTAAYWVRDNGDLVLEVAVFAIAFFRAVAVTRERSGRR